MALFNIGRKRSEDMSSVVNASKTLLANIRFMDVDNPVRVMAITSCVPNEGKTFVSINLATAIATSGKSVLLVECDMRRRSMSRALGVHAQHGIYSVMSGECELHEAAVSTHTPNLSFLDAEPRIPNPSDLLNSLRFTRLIETARNSYDYVVFDTPPVGTFIDAAVLGTKVDAVFMVIRENYVRKAEVAASAEQLKKSGCNLAGCIMNYCERSSSEYYYEYYDTQDDESHDSSAPKLSIPSQRRHRHGTRGVMMVPSSSPPRSGYRKPSGDESLASVPTPSPVPEPVADDTGVYERLAEQVAQAQLAARANSSIENEF